MTAAGMPRARIPGHDPAELVDSCNVFTYLRVTHKYWRQGLRSMCKHLVHLLCCSSHPLCLHWHISSGAAGNGFAAAATGEVQGAGHTHLQGLGALADGGATAVHGGSGLRTAQLTPSSMDLDTVIAVRLLRARAAHAGAGLQTSKALTRWHDKGFIQAAQQGQSRQAQINLRLDARLGETSQQG